MLTARELIDQFEQALTNHAWERCAEICFRILYGMPEDIQRTLVITMMRRYLPIFHIRWQTSTWPDQIIDQPQQWVAQLGREIPEQPEAVNPADAAFIYSFDAFLNGIAHQSDSAILTSSYVTSINAVINARAANVWIADDPEAVALWEAQGYFPGRSIAENSAAVAVTVREWRVVVEWLTQHTQSFSFEDLSAVERALTRWKDHEMSLIIPRPIEGKD
jgi:hypothetical protein